MAWLLEEHRARPAKQRHTAKRIFDRLRDGYGFDGSYTIVKDYVRERRRRTREMYVPLSHPPGHAQVDFGKAPAEIGGKHDARGGQDPGGWPTPTNPGVCRASVPLPVSGPFWSAGQGQ